MPRLIFIDNLRWCMILLVLSMHAAVTYSGEEAGIISNREN